MHMDLYGHHNKDGGEANIRVTEKKEELQKKKEKLRKKKLKTGLRKEK